MKRKAAIAAVPAALQLSPLEAYERDREAWEPGVVRDLTRIVERAADMRAAFIAKVQRGNAGDLAYQAAWGKETFCADYEALTASTILAHYEREPDGTTATWPRTKRERLAQVVRYFHDELTRKLVRDWLPANSTSEWHRAAEATERSAAAWMVERLGHFISHHDEIEERGARLGS